MDVNALRKFLLPPIAIYATIFLFISALIGAKIDQEALWVWVVTLIISIVGLYFATNYLKPKTIQEGLRLGVVWLIVLFLLDLVLTVPFTGTEYFADWRSYVSYFLTLAIPTVLSKK